MPPTSLLAAILFLIVGLAALTAGAEVFVRGASRLAALMGVSPLVIGLTVVAYGTSSPELAVSVSSAAAGSVDLAIGNVVGSNICNVLLVLGLSALIAPLAVSRQLIRWEVPLMVGVSFLPLVMGLDGRLSRPDGLLLFAGCVLYTWWSVRESRRETLAAHEANGTRPPSGPRRWRGQVALTLTGLVVLTVGSYAVVQGAVGVARLLGVGELVIGLTIIALGTSLPELATSLVASIRGERDIAVGNIVGSNLFNILMVLGLTAVVAPGGIHVPPSALTFDLPIMIAVAVSCLPIFLTGSIISRWEGGFFVLYYIAYIVYLVIEGGQRPSTTTFDTLLMVFVVPMVLIAVLGTGRWLLWTRRRLRVNHDLPMV